MIGSSSSVSSSQKPEPSPLLYYDSAKIGIPNLKRQWIDRQNFDPNLADLHGNTALLLATADGNIDCVKIFLALKASVDARNREGWSPITRAIQKDFTQILTLLLESAKNQNLYSIDDELLPNYVVTQDIRGDEDEPLPPMDYTCLQLASRLGHLEACKTLINLGKVNVNAANNFGWSALHIAAAYNQPAVVSLLLQNGANVNSVTSGDVQCSALHLAVIRGDLKDIVSILLEAGIDYRLVTPKGYTALQIAKEKKRVECLKILTDVSADNSKGPSRIKAKWTEQAILRTIEECREKKASVLKLMGAYVQLVPPKLAQCADLTGLDLSGNCLTILPVAPLTNLRWLNLSYNYFQRIPSSVSHLTNLTELNMTHNTPATEIEKKLMMRGDLSKIRDYLQSEGERIVPTQVRMLIVGQEKVGKTSLLLCLKSKSNRPPPQTTTLISTDGVDITSFYLPVHFDPNQSLKRGSAPGVVLPERTERERGPTAAPALSSPSSSPTSGSPLSGERSGSPAVATLTSEKMNPLNLWSLRAERSREIDVEFTTWDFAGQKVYATTHEYFMGSASLYLLVWDLRYPILQNIQFWLRSIASRTSEVAHVVLVGTHLDDKYLDPLTLKKQLAEVRNIYHPQLLQGAQMPSWLKKIQVDEVFTVSCLTGKGIAELKNRLAQIAGHLLTSKPAQPRSFREVGIHCSLLARERRFTNQPPVMTLTEIQSALSSPHGLDASIVPELLSFLHAQGTILHFPDAAGTTSYCVSLEHCKSSARLSQEEDPMMFRSGMTLADLVILDPQWITNFLSSMISTKNAFVKRGILYSSDLPFLWREYPSRLYPFLIQLLQIFEIVYPFTPVQQPQIQSASTSTTANSSSVATSGNPMHASSATLATAAPSSSASAPTITNTGPPLSSLPIFTTGPSGGGLSSSTLLSASATASDRKITAIPQPNEQLVMLPNLSWIVPCMLPEDPPTYSLLWPKVDRTKITLTRNYTLPFVPYGLFPRLFIQLMQLEIQCQVYWRTGILFSSTVEVPLVSLVYLDLGTSTVRVNIRSPLDTSINPAVKLLRVILDMLHLLLDNWYHLERPVITVSCPRCLDDGATNAPEFTLEDLQADAARGLYSATCPATAASAHQQHIARLDFLAPDVMMTDVAGSLISIESLQMGKLIGKGSFGIIYKATYKDPNNARAPAEIVAVKEIETEEQLLELNRTKAGTEVHTNAKMKLSSLFEEFRTECVLMMSLKHPNVVKLIGYSLTPRLLIVLEFLPIGSLYNILHDNALKLPRVTRLRIALETALGMRFLHHGVTPPVLHRDLKSPNVLIASTDPMSRDAVAKITDFGLSLHLHVDQLKAKDGKTRHVVNPTWLAPEILNMSMETTKSDVYSFGVILWEILTRQHPFEEFKFKFAWQHEDAVRRGVRPTIPLRFGSNKGGSGGGGSSSTSALASPQAPSASNNDQYTPTIPTTRERAQSHQARISPQRERHGDVGASTSPMPSRKVTTSGSAIARPSATEEDDMPVAIADLIRSCWQQEASSRPAFTSICQTLQSLYQMHPEYPLPPALIVSATSSGSFGGVPRAYSAGLAKTDSNTTITKTNSNSPAAAKSLSSNVASDRPPLPSQSSSPSLLTDRELLARADQTPSKPPEKLQRANTWTAGSAHGTQLYARQVITRLVSVREHEIWAACESGMILIFDTLSGKCTETFEAHVDAVTALAFIPSINVIMASAIGNAGSVPIEASPGSVWSGGRDGVLRVWKLRPQAVKQKILQSGFLEVSFSETETSSSSSSSSPAASLALVGLGGGSSSNLLNNKEKDEDHRWMRKYVVINSETNQLLLYKDAFDTRQAQRVYSLTKGEAVSVDGLKKRDLLVKVKEGGDDSKGDRKELLLSFSTTGEKHTWMEALLRCIIASAKPQSFHGLGPLPHPSPTPITALAYVPQQQQVISCAQSSLKITVWNATNCQRIRDVEPFGEKPNFSVSFILQWKDSLLLVVEKIVFVTDLELRFKTGLTNERSVWASVLVNNSHLWVADRRAIHIFDLASSKQVKTLAQIENVSAMVQVGDVVWAASCASGLPKGSGPSIHRFDATLCVPLNSFVSKHSQPISAMSVVGGNQVWAASKDKTIYVWKA